MQTLKLQGLFAPRFWQNLVPLPAQPSLQRGQKLPDFLLPDATHRTTVKLSSFVGESPVLLAFTRIFTENHYCPLCYPHIIELNQQYERFTDQGIAVLMIASTDSRQSQRVVADLGLKMPLLSNPSCDVFRLYGTGQALGAPLPAQLLMDREGRLAYQHRFSFLEPNASVDKLLQICQDLENND